MSESERSHWSNFFEHLSRGLDDDFPFRSVQSLLIRRQCLLLSDLGLTHHDRLAAIDFLHNAMDHRADPVHLASDKFPKPCFVLLYIQYEPQWPPKGHRSDENLLLVSKTITGRDYTHLDLVIRTSCIKHGERNIHETTKKHEYVTTNRTTGITSNTLTSWYTDCAEGSGRSDRQGEIWLRVVDMIVHGG